MHKVSAEKETKNDNEFNASVTLRHSGTLRSQRCIFFCQEPEYFLLKTSIMCPFSVILVLNLNLVHVRICDVDTLCFFLPAKRGSYRSSAGLSLH